MRPGRAFGRPALGYPDADSMKLLHFADLHLDAPFAWASPETARSRRRNRRDALTQIVALAEAESVDAILSAGDLFEQDRIGPDTVEFLRSTFERTDRRVYLAPGNHDWLSPRSPYALVEWSPNVHVFTEAELRPVELDDWADPVGGRAPRAGQHRRPLSRVPRRPRRRARRPCPCVGARDPGMAGVG